MILPEEKNIIEITELLNGAKPNVGYWSNKLIKEGSLCHLELAVIPNSTEEINILKLEERFRPKKACTGLIFKDSTIAKCIINADGTVVIKVPSQITNTWNLTATWSLF